MGLFNRKNSSTPSNPAMTELGREFAIARRHGDRKTMRRIGRQYDATETDAASFQRGQDAYDAIPPIKPARRNRRR